MPKGSHLTGVGGPGRPVGTSAAQSKESQLLKMELCVRYKIANPNLPDKDIATHFGVSPITFSTWKNTPEWQRIYNTVTTNILGELDEDIKHGVEFQMKKLRTIGVPTALNNLLSAALQTKNVKLQMDASKEILDRSGQFAKVSRIGMPTEAQGGVSDAIDNDVAAELIQALTAAKASQVSRNAASVEATIDSKPASPEVQ